MTRIGERLKQHWIQQNVFVEHSSWNTQTLQRSRAMMEKALSGAEEAEIAHFEAHYDVRLPEDFRQYFYAVNGMGGSRSEVMDNSLLCFWSIEDIKNVAEEYANFPQSILEPASLFIFADYCIESFYFAIKLSRDPHQPTPVYWMGNLPEPKLADSFSDFAEIYLADAELVINPHRDKKL